MTPKKNIGNFVLMLTLIYLCVNTGCAQTGRTIPLGPQRYCTCEEVQASGVHGFSDSEIASLLDRALINDRLADCWIPVMEKCLNQGREIPQKHLAKAVHVFNKRQHEGLFHKATLNYLSNLADGESAFRAEDRLLLETYCSYLINNAKTRHDKSLQQASLICRRLDQNLYARLFN